MFENLTGQEWVELLKTLGRATAATNKLARYVAPCPRLWEPTWAMHCEITQLHLDVATAFSPVRAGAR